MKRLVLILAGAAMAGGVAAAPAVAGLAGNPSFSHEIPVPVPSMAKTPLFADDRSHDASTAPRTAAAEPADDHGGTTRHAEPGDDRGGIEPGDDRGGATPEAEPGDDRGGITPEAEPAGDRDGQTPQAEPSDDRGGSTPAPGASDDRGGQHGGRG